MNTRVFIADRIFEGDRVMMAFKIRMKYILIQLISQIMFLSYLIRLILVDNKNLKLKKSYKNDTKFN